MKKSNLGLYAIVLLLALVGLAYYGGLPAPDEMPFFILGAVILVGLSLLIGALGWFLLYRPLPENYKISTESPLSPFTRQILALILLINMSLIALGGAWDEVWHSLYGIPFGEDFLWRPHILIYIGLITLIVFALGLTIVFLVKGKGTLAQRLRSDILLAYLIFVGLFMVYALPADPIWHEIYGADLSSFSIPHVLLSFMFILPLFVVIGVFISSYPKRNWQSVFALRAADFPPIIAFVVIQLVLYMLFAAGWELMTLIPPTVAVNEIYPDWLFPLLVVFTASFVGILANHSLRYYGAATLTGLLSIGLRLLLLRLLGHELQMAYVWTIALAVDVCIDAFYFLRRGNIPTRWQAGLLTASAMVVLGLPMINFFYPSPEINVDNIFSVLIAVVGGALLASWFAQALGDYLADSPRHLAEESSTSRLFRLAGVVFVATLLFFLWFVMTATAPVA